MNRHFEFEGPVGFNGDASAMVEGRPAGGVAGDPRVDVTASSSGTATEAVVKWFRSDKGYGFVEMSGGRGDAFLHLKALRAFGRETTSIGARLRVVVDDGPRGAQVKHVIDIDDSCAGPPPERGFSNGPHSFRRPARDVSSAFDLTGRVKWFDGARGFGFVAGDDFGRDVFVHCSILGPTGLSRLAEGQAVTMRVIETPKGREAVEISL